MPGSWELGLAFAFLLALLVVDASSYLDRGLYAACLPLLAYLVWPSERPIDSKSAVSEERVVVKSAGKQIIITHSQILAIHGAGNYAEIELQGGKKILDDRALNQLANELPIGFFRVHRSHIVNLDYVIALHSLGAGRHRLELKDHTQLPVSRERITELRRLIRGLTS